MASASPGRTVRSHAPLALVCVAAIALLLTACGGSDEKASGVASLGGNASTTTVPKQASATDTRKAWLAAAACMRKQGVDFPDPTFDANGRPQFSQNGTTGQGRGGGPGGIFRSNDPKVQAARKACASEFQQIRGQFRQLTPAEAAQRKQQILALAACMRKQGVDFPDPTFDANGRPEFGQGGQGAGAAGDRRDDPAFQKAMQACRQQLGTTFGPGGGPGGPGGGNGGSASGGGSGGASGSGGSGSGASTTAGTGSA
jgi:hypothetical protein